ncbi:MAG: hypothetical protein H6605_06735 [Flavobacteriales bacterium]|nr:hypothetical protein [Flavobacteriales bacterium]
MPIILFFTLKTNACDVCGCSMGGNNLGILPQFQKNFIGFNYSHRSFVSEHSILGSETNVFSKETFHSLDLRGKFFLNRKIQLFVIAPFSQNQQQQDSVNTIIRGIGDFSAFANYILFNNGDSLRKKWKHNVQFGGGVKLPTGNFNKPDEKNILNPNLQTGTGSFDILTNLIYTVRYKKWGLNTIVFYRFNNRNSNEYKFGNRLSVNSSLFYWANVKGYSLLPNLGLEYSSAEKDVHNAYVVAQSGGSLYFGTCGLDVYLRNITFGYKFQLPIYQSNPVISGKSANNFTLLYNFTRKK